MTTTTATPHRFRLRAEVDGRLRVYDLGADGGILGSQKQAELVIMAHGVSRRHARLVPGDDGIVVTDLGSKNGTFVNGQRIQSATVDDGDTVRVGPIVLVVERIDVADAELGLALEPDGPATLTEIAVGETSLVSGDHEAARLWLELTYDVLGLLTRTPQGDHDAAVARLAQSLEAEGVAVVEWPEGGRPTILAAAGRVGDLPHGRIVREATPDRRDPALRWLEPLGTTPMACAVVVPRADDPIGLAIWGATAVDTAGRPLLRILARLANLTRPRALAPLDAEADAPPDALVFPPGYVRASSAAMGQLYAQMRALGDDVPVLIVGETGVGKELVARTVHLSSSRRDGPLVTINCAALPAELLEAELFGIGRGVATGVNPRPGKFLDAQGGTLFLDEIGDMAPVLQAKLLRALQEKEIHPLGKAAVRVDVRVVAATNTDLRQRMADGGFRRDLYYRLAGYELPIPALRQRREDVPQLIAHFMRTFADGAGKQVRGVTVKALQALVDYAWPGNVRELEHEVRRMVDRCPNGRAVDSSLISESIVHPPPDVERLRDDIDLDEPKLDVHLEAVERRLVEYAMTKTRGNQSQAAKLLGISRNGLAKRLKRLGMRPGDPRPFD